MTEYNLPISAKHIEIDLRGPAGNAYAVRGTIVSILEQISDELVKQYGKELDDAPAEQKTYNNLIRISRKYVDLKWRGLSLVRA